MGCLPAKRNIYYNRRKKQTKQFRCGFKLKSAAIISGLSFWNFETCKIALIFLAIFFYNLLIIYLIFYIV